MPWHKGQSGNPGGLSKGSRRKLTDAFIRALARDWAQHGEGVIKRVREEDPVAYVKVVAGLLPKDVNVEGNMAVSLIDAIQHAAARRDSRTTEEEGSELSCDQDQPLH